MAGHLIIQRLTDVVSRAVQWLDPGRIPLGTVTILDGDPGVGKSTLALDYAARVSRGSRMPGGGVGRTWKEPAGVVVVSAEDDASITIRPKLEAMGADIQRIALLHGVGKSEEDDEGKMVTLGDIEILEQAIDYIAARLVIVDPFMAYIPGKLHAHSDQDMRAMLSPLTKMAGRMDVAFLVVRHLNKLSGDNRTNVAALYRGGGSIGISGAARSVMLVAFDPTDESREKRIYVRVKGNLSKPPPSLAFTLITSSTNPDIPIIAGWEVVSETADELLSPPTMLDEACKWLAERLEDGEEHDTQVVFREGKKFDLTTSALRKARKRIGAVARCKGRKKTAAGGDTVEWVWVLQADKREKKPLSTGNGRCYW